MRDGINQISKRREFAGMVISKLINSRIKSRKGQEEYIQNNCHEISGNINCFSPRAEWDHRINTTRID